MLVGVVDSVVMSPPTAHENDRFGTSLDPLTYVRKPVEVVGFWAAVVLPFLYVPLFASGLKSEDAMVAFAVLVALHVVALVAGRNHKS